MSRLVPDWNNVPVEKEKKESKERGRIAQFSGMRIFSYLIFPGEIIMYLENNCSLSRKRNVRSLI